MELTMAGKLFNTATGSALIGPTMYAEFPEVETFSRILKFSENILISNNDKIYEITGVIENLKQNTHLPIDIICSFSSLTQNPRYNQMATAWTSFPFYNYIKLKTDSDYKITENIINFEGNSQIKAPVIGVVNYFNYASLRESVEPLLISILSTGSIESDFQVR